MTGPGTRLRELFDRPELTWMPVVQDPLTAKLAELAGFEAVSLGSSTVSGCLGLPDCGFLTLTEMEFFVSRLAEVTDVPVKVDAETGYGNAVNVRHTVRRLERAGAAGMTLEDQEYPPQLGGGPVISTEEMEGKIKAAVDARRDDSFVVFARTDAVGRYGLDEAIDRANRYVEAGADGCLAVPLLSIADMTRYVAEVPARYHLGDTPNWTGFPTGDALTAMGFSASVVGITALREGTFTTLRCLKELRHLADANEPVEGPEGSWLRGDEGFRRRWEEWNGITGLDVVREIEKTYLPPDLLAHRARHKGG